MAASIAVAALVGGATPGAAVDGRPGVTGSEIRVGGVESGAASPSRDKAGHRYGLALDGVSAAFAEVNANGGVFGRQFRLVARLDDRGSASANVVANRRLVEDRHVFAVIPEAVQQFTAARYLAGTGTPTLGWNTDAAWSSGTNLFGERGSYRCYSCPAVGAAFVARQVGATKAAVLTTTSPLAVDCADGLVNGLDKYGVEVSFRAIVAPVSLAADVDAVMPRVRDAGVQLVATCMLGTDGVATAVAALRAAGLSTVSVYATEGYGPALLAALGAKVDGVYLGLPFVPWEVAPQPEGTQRFLAAMKGRHLVPTEAAQAGWIDAQLLVAGVEAAGDRFTQQSVVDAINAMTSFDAGGMLAGVDWAHAGHGPGREVCTAFVEARRRRFRPRFGPPGSPFACFPDNPLPAALDSPNPPSEPPAP